jgi:hypothetical protein|tara:strand:- start:37 stop:285 length:249 start_codon:yes stop_codon:yes gene_type:complete
MTHINGIPALATSSVASLSGLSTLEAVLTALGEGHTSPSDLSDYLLTLELAARKVSIMALDAFEAEVAMELAVLSTRIAVAS